MIVIVYCGVVAVILKTWCTTLVLKRLRSLILCASPLTSSRVCTRVSFTVFSFFVFSFLFPEWGQEVFKVSYFCRKLHHSPATGLMFSRWLILGDVVVSFFCSKKSQLFYPPAGVQRSDLFESLINVCRVRREIKFSRLLQETVLRWLQSCWLSLWLQVSAALV